MLNKIDAFHKILFWFIVPSVLFYAVWSGFTNEPTSEKNFIESLHYTQEQEKSEFRFCLEGKVIDISGKENYKYKLDNEFDSFIELPYKEDTLFFTGEVYVMKYQSSQYSIFPYHFFNEAKLIYYIPSIINDEKMVQVQITDFKNNVPSQLYEKYVKAFYENDTEDSFAPLWIFFHGLLLIIYLIISAILIKINVKNRKRQKENLMQ